MKLQHLASAPDGGVQECSRCGILIVDRRGAIMAEGSGVNPFWPIGQVFQMGICWIGSVADSKEFMECSKEGNA